MIILNFKINKNFKYHNEKYKELIKLLRAFVSEADNYLVKGKGTEGYEEVLEFYYEVRSFIAASELYTLNLPGIPVLTLSFLSVIFTLKSTYEFVIVMSFAKTLQ